MATGLVKVERSKFRKDEGVLIDPEDGALVQTEDGRHGDGNGTLGADQGHGHPQGNFELGAYRDD